MSKETSDVYQLLTNKGFELIKYDESDWCRGNWQYAFNYDKANNKANAWIDYKFYDNEKQAEKFGWKEDWRSKVSGDKTPQPTYAKNEIELIIYDKDLFQKITSQISNTYSKKEVVFDEANTTYIFKFKNPDSEYIYYQIGESYYLLISYTDREREKIINDYWK